MDVDNNAEDSNTKRSKRSLNNENENPENITQSTEGMQKKTNTYLYFKKEIR
jgi:hypothetical protein